jgi:hypothetical protein
MTENQIKSLERIKSLFESGTISKEEMEKLKNDILSNQKKQKSSSSSKVGIKRKYLLISLCIFFIIAVVFVIINKSKLVFSNEEKNDLAQYELKGNVKYMITNNWHLVDSEEIYGFNKDGFVSYLKSGENETSSIQRDKNNRITSSQKYALIGDVGDIYLDGIKDKYKYNTDGKIESITTEHSTFDEISGISSTDFKYDAKGNVIELINKNEVQNTKTRFILKYDLKDSIIEKIEKSAYFETKVVYEYNDNGLKVRIANYNEDGELDTEYKYKYDDKGNKIEEENLYGGKSNWKNKFIYDEKNRLVRVDKKTKKIGWKKLYEYSYDDNDNWIKRTEYGENGEVSTATRNITYYSDEELKSNSDFNFESEFGSKPIESNSQNENDNYKSDSFGEIRGRIIGGNLRMLKNELGSPTYTDLATNFIKNIYNTNLSIGLFDLCLNYEVYVYESYLEYDSNLLVIVSDGKVTNVIPQNEVQDVKDICCCD